MKMKNIQKDNRGMIIVFTLIMLAVFLTTALSFSYFIISDINKAKAIDNSIIAYYSADAGMEESLFLLKNQELAESVESLKSKRPSPIKMTLSKGMWDISSSTSYETSVLRQRLYNGQSVKFFILNRGVSIGQNITKSITLEWHEGGEGSTAKLQASMTQLTSQVGDNNSLIYFTDRSELEVDDLLVKCFDLKDRDFSGIILSPLPDYLVEYKVLGENNEDFVDTLIVRANNKSCGDPGYAENFNPQGITNPTVKSSGTYGRSTQSIIAHILPKDPVSGLLGFVLFSEQDVTKE